MQSLDFQCRYLHLPDNLRKDLLCRPLFHRAAQVLGERGRHNLRWQLVQLGHLLRLLGSFRFGGLIGCEHRWSSVIWRYSPIDFPLITSPKTTCLPSRWDVGATVMKNWDPFVPGPALACRTSSVLWEQSATCKMYTMDSKNGFVWLTRKASSSNLSPYIDSPPVPVERVD